MAIAGTAETPARDVIEVPGVRAFVLPMMCDAGLPTAAYYVARMIGGAPYVSLLAGTAVAGARVVVVASRSRRLDAIAAFLLVVFGIGLAFSFMTGDARFLLAKGSVSTAAAGLIFIGSCATSTPLAYVWGRRIMARTPALHNRWADLWSTRTAFRRVCYVVSFTWGLGLLLEAGVRIALIYAVSIDAMAGLSSALSLATVSLLAGWTVWYARWVQR